MRLWNWVDATGESLRMSLCSSVAGGNVEIWKYFLIVVESIKLSWWKKSANRANRNLRSRVGLWPLRLLC